MSMWGGGGPAFGGGQHSSAQAGLPFAGIPEELRHLAEEILEEEPSFDHEQVSFTRIPEDDRRFTLRRFLAPHKLAMFGVFIVVVLETVAAQAGPLLTQIGIDRGIATNNLVALGIVSVLYLFAVLMSTYMGRMRLLVAGRVGERLLHELRMRVFTHLQRLGLDFFTREKAGRIMTRMTSDIEALTQLFHEGLVNLAVQGLTLIVVATILFAMNFQLALFTIGFVMPVMLGLTLWFRRASDRGYDAVRERIADVLADLQESLSGVRIVTAHNRQKHNINRHRNIVGSYQDANIYTGRVGAIYGPSTEGLGVLGQALVIGVGGAMFFAGNLTIGELTAFVLYLTSFFAPIQQLVNLYNTYQQGRAAINKLSDLLAEDPSVAEDPDATDLPATEGEIQLEDVTFAYEGTPVLSNLDLRIAPGETFALVGPTGAGKSTVVKLIARFYDPDTGRVTIDGHDIRTVKQTSLRTQIGNVPQEPFLFAGSIRDNIAFARPDASEEEVMEACRAVGIDDLIERLPDGLDTPCHERGVSLSSGERQLLALARAFLAKPRVLILDEATSSLDLRTEAKIEHALDLLLEGRTAIVIAHRLSTAMRADRLAVVEDGQIVELGSHQELVALGGRYAAMYETWMSHAEGISTH